MATQIFVRTRNRQREGEKKPRFRVVGVSGGDLKIYADHMRRQELDAIAAATGAEVVFLEDPRDGSTKKQT